MRRSWLLAVALAAAAVAVAAVALIRDHPSAAADPPGFSGNPAGRKPVIFDLGALAYDPAQRGRALAEVRALGADAVRVLVQWSFVAPKRRPSGFHPADPNDSHYDWSLYDPFLQAARRNELKILLSPTGPAPAWAADAGSAGLSDPDPRQFGAFVGALAGRYNGHFKAAKQGPALPKADLWAIWNEPNLSTFLQPQYRGGQAYSPLLYRRLYLSAQQAIHDRQPSAPILIGETAPTGGERSVDPLTFARQTLCLNASFDPLGHCPRADDEIDAVGWSTHPYPLVGRAPFEAVTNPNFVTMSSLGALTSTLSSAADAGRIASGLPLYITEFGIQTYPDPNAVSLQQQAAYIAIAERFAYADPSVVSFAQYLLADDSPRAVAGQTYGGFESGLRFNAGAKKPSYDAFRLPLAVQRLSGRVSLWGIVQAYPHPTDVQIRYKNPGRPARSLQTIRTNEIGIYTTTFGNSPGRRWQAVWHSPVDGHTYRGPWIRSLRYAAPG